MAHPDVSKRIARGLLLHADDRATFYTRGPQGYVDDPFYREPATAIA
jgi:hypothetical protein